MTQYELLQTAESILSMLNANEIDAKDVIYLKS